MNPKLKHRLRIGIAALALPMVATAGSMGMELMPYPMMPPLGMQKTGMPEAPPPSPFQPMLTDAQQDKAFALMHAQMPKQREKMREASKAMQELRKLTEADKFDQAHARALADTIGRATGELALMRAELDAQLRSLLTKEQKKAPEARKGPRADCPPHHP